MKIVLDAGHFINTAGKRTPDGIREWTINNSVCNYIEEYLKEYENIEVFRVDDRTGKTETTLASRVKKINDINPSVAISIHHNAFTGKWGTHGGTEVYHHTLGSVKDKELATIIAPLLAKKCGLRNRGVKKAQFTILNCNPSIPAVLCEGGFMDSTIDKPVICSQKGQRAYAMAVVESLVKFLKLKKEEPIQVIEKIVYKDRVVEKEIVKEVIVEKKSIVEEALRILIEFIKKIWQK